jgi:hypothetical protein
LWVTTTLKKIGPTGVMKCKLLAEYKNEVTLRKARRININPCAVCNQIYVAVTIDGIQISLFTST